MKKSYSKFLNKEKFIDKREGLRHTVKRGKKLYVLNDVNYIKTNRKKDRNQYATMLRGAIQS